MNHLSASSNTRVTNVWYLLQNVTKRIGNQSVDVGVREKVLSVESGADAGVFLTDSATARRRHASHQSLNNKDDSIRC